MSNIVDIYLIGGQSNADGRQASPVNPLAEADGTLTGLLMYKSTTGNFANWQIGVNNGSFTPTSTEWCPFGYALKQYRDWLTVPELYCVKTTRGGVSLAATASTTGSFYWDTTLVTGESVMFDQLQTRIEAARYILARQGKYARFKAMLWHQGENDENEPYASAYESNLTTLIQKTRQLCWNPTMPWIMGTIPTVSAGYSATVKAAQEAVAAADANVYCIDLSSQPIYDSYHFNNVGKEYFGDQVFSILQTL